MTHLGPSLRRTKVRERPGVRTALAALASLALNALLFVLLARAGAFQLAPVHEATRVSLAPIGADQWAKNRSIAPAAPSPEAEPRSGKLVELPPDAKADERPPPDTRFLSDRNHRAGKQTVSRYAGVYPNLAPKPEMRAGTRREAGGDEGRENSSAKGREGAPAPSVKPPPDRDEGLARSDGGEGGRRSEGKRGPDLSVGPESLARALAGPNMDGTHEGLEQGETTNLDTREFKYATFLNRMRGAIGDQWYPRVRSASHDRDPDGSMFFYKERTVVLSLTLDVSGRLTDLSVLESSSIDFFDSVAEAAVRAAQPFPNPPRGMFGGDGVTHIPFAFTLYPAESRPAIRWGPFGR